MDAELLKIVTLILDEMGLEVFIVKSEGDDEKVELSSFDRGKPARNDYILVRKP